MAKKDLLETIKEKQHALANELDDIRECTTMSQGDCFMIVYGGGLLCFEYDEDATDAATVLLHPYVLTPDSNPGKWIEKAPAGRYATIEMSDYDVGTDITTGTGKFVTRMPHAMTLTDVRASLAGAPTGASVVVDINESATTILSTKLSIDVSAAATGTVTLTAGAAGSVNTVKVNGVTVTSAGVAYNASLSQTATDVASNITAHTSSPDYNAAAVGAVITLTAVTLGTGTNDFVVLSTNTTIESTDVDMSGGTSGKTSTTAATPAVISDTTLADDAEITVDIDVIGSSAAGKGLKVWLIGTRN